ncbi:30S ribosomal protein S4 [Alicyclobacillus fastidiosus]|uniref:Small ribosomal subunit protein uS4 n=1 Tax=Alicyclobacillus fastidiosus TaxID=392011 RepID=A0ABV5A9S3_9BACL|nr:30S ribosomal protein S4 [Alicyclobacillus fastidiosus]WEH10919.1 30S ribosomal protein S4 [Alicyclobacillus fastidiosus]
MARRTGAKHKLCRTVGEALCGSPKCPALKRPYPPGQHGPAKRMKRSEYGVQLLEKQKLRHIYGVQEKQFRRYYEEAARRSGITGDTLLTILETRLDNLVFRLGFSNTIDGARQLVNHGHVAVNGRRVDIPSYRARVGDIIGLTNQGHKVSVIDEALEGHVTRPPYLTFDAASTTGTLVSIPTRSEIPVHVNETLIVEYYSR